MNQSVLLVSDIYLIKEQFCVIINTDLMWTLLTIILFILYYYHQDTEYVLYIYIYEAVDFFHELQVVTTPNQDSG